MPDDLTVFAVDDQLTFLQATASVIAATDGFRLIGCASSGQSALDRLAVIADGVDLVLLDIELGDLDGLNGLNVAKQMVQTSPGLSVVYLSMLDEDDVRDELSGSGAIGFMAKATFGPASLEALLPTLQRHRLLWAR